MNILFMVDYWKPIASANVVCARNVMYALQKKGHQIYVSAYSDCKTCSDESDGIYIEYVKPTFARRLLNYSKFACNPFSRRTASFLGKMMNRCRRIILLPFYPIVSLLFAHRWSKQVHDMICTHNIDAVVSVIAPDDALYSGYRVKSLCPAIKWIPYYIDNGSNVLSGTSFEMFKYAMQKKAIRWENRVLSKSSGIIVMKGHEHHYRKVLSEKNQKKLFVANVPLFKKMNQCKTHSKNTRERWIYAGSMSGEYYKPEVIVAFFEEYRKHRNAELHLFGPTDKTEYLTKITKDKNTGITWHGMVNHDELYREYEESDVMVYYINSKLDSISGKFFEYIQYGKPVVFVGYNNDINANWVRQYPKGIVVPSDYNEETISDLPKKIDNAVSLECSIERMNELFRESTPEYATMIIEQVLYEK